MTVRDLLGSGDVKVLGSGKVSISTATTTSVDFGTPDDINLETNANYKPGDRVVAVFTSSTGGTADTTGFVVQDAPDSSGSIGTPATAITGTAISGSLAGGTGDQLAIIPVRVQNGRPWLRFRATRASGTTDTTVVKCHVLAIPRVL